MKKKVRVWQWSLVVGIAGLLAVAGGALGQDTPVGPPSVPQPAVRPGPQSQGENPNDVRKQPSAQSVSGPGAPVNSSSYKIGAADVLNIHVWDEPSFSGPVIVHEDGKFTMPLVGDLKAGGLTPVEVQNEVTSALDKLIRKPLVTVTVQQVGSKQYYMDGQIARAGEYPLLVPTTVFEAISKAGGPAPFANRSKIYVLRGSTRLKFNYKDVLRGKNMSQNILLKPGDHVVIP